MHTNIIQSFCLVLSILGCSLCQGQDIILGKGNNVNIVTSSSDTTTSGTATISSQGFLPNLNASSRFLSQASFGPNFEEINNLSTMGLENWIDDQFTQPRAFSIMDSILGYNDLYHGSMFIDFDNNRLDINQNY